VQVWRRQASSRPAKPAFFSLALGLFALHWLLWPLALASRFALALLVLASLCMAFAMSLPLPLLARCPLPIVLPAARSSALCARPGSRSQYNSQYKSQCSSYICQKSSMS
jgi:hypothetical protein